MVEHPGLIGARLHELNRAAVIAGIAYSRERLFRVLAQGLADKMLGEEAAGGGCPRTEGEGLALNAPRKILRELETGRRVGNEVALELQVFLALSNGLRSWNGKARLHSRQAAKPCELDLVVGEGRDGCRIALDR